MALFQRYETSMRRSWDRALDRLQWMRATHQNRAGEQADAVPPNDPVPETNTNPT